VNLPIGVIALLLVGRLVPSSSRGDRRDLHLDLVGVLLLGAGVLGLLLPLVTTETGRPGRLWPLLGLAALLFVTFAWWEARMARHGRQPLLDPRLARTPGYAVGTGIGLIYFSGFTGIWLVLAVFFQSGLGYSPLRSGLAVTPFAFGVAVSAVLAGRLVARVGRWLTVAGLVAMIVGLSSAALVLRHVGGNAAAWTVAGPLLLAGLGGGMVTSPNMTLTLQDVPVSMAGAAGGALQTAQRIGSAVGTALLASVYYRVLGTGRDHPAAASDALLASCGFLTLALVLAVAETARRRLRRRERSTPHAAPNEHVLHL
jgi:MFS family permease